jgi:hypothetical protein
MKNFNFKGQLIPLLLIQSNRRLTVQSIDPSTFNLFICLSKEMNKLIEKLYNKVPFV